MNMNFRSSGHRWLLTLSLAVLCAFGTHLAPLVAQDLKDFKNPLRLNLPGQNATDAVPATVKIAVSPTDVKAGDTITFSVQVDVPPGSYTYSMSPKFGGGTKVKFKTEEGVQALGSFEPDHPPKVEFSKEFEQNIEKYTKSVTWTRKYKVTGTTPPRLQGTLEYQVCDGQGCRMPRQSFDLELTLADGVTPVAKRGATPVTAASADDRFEQAAKIRNNPSKAWMRIRPINAQPGDEVALEFHVELAADWHIYSTTQPEENAAAATEINVETHAGLKELEPEFLPDRPHQTKHKEIAGEKVVHEIYEHQVTWTRKFQLLPGTKLEDVKVQGKVLFQVCKDGVGCIPGSLKFNLPQPNQVATLPTTKTAQVPTSTDLTPVPEGTANETASKGASQFRDLSDAECVASTTDGDIRDRGVLYVLGAAFVFGWLALLTPCVFPMVPITVSFFLKQAEKKHNSPLRMALVYCLSIIGTFTVLGLIVSALFGATYINSLANGIFINLFLGIVLMFFALNLLGLFDIQIPSWLLTFTASKESTSSYLGVFFMALTFTLTSFTCTFAFLGLILVWAANGEFWWPLGGLIAFSTAFAMPFFLLALFPSYLHKLPKSGGWMNRVKVIMGLIEMAFMFKFLSVADIAWNSTPTIFDYHLVMSAWMAIAIIAGLYLLGKIQLPHDTKEEYVGVLPMVVAMFFLGLAGYLGVGIFAHEPPGGFFGRQIVAFAPPRFEGGVGEDGAFLIGKHDKQKYLLEFERAKEKARKEQVPLFIDFTGVNCINCREMEALMAESSIQAQLQRFVRVQLYTDKMPKEAVGDIKQGEALLDRNRGLQEEWYKDTVLPGYAVVSPDGTVILSKIKGKVSASSFTTFLQCGFNKWERSKRAEVASVKP